MLRRTLSAALAVLPLLAQEAVQGAHRARALIFLEQPLIDLSGWLIAVRRAVQDLDDVFTFVRTQCAGLYGLLS